MTLPLLIAHRFANDLSSLAHAESAGAAMVEADVWAYRGNLEVRHRKTMGPIPLLWDRWSLTGAWRPRLTLARLAGSAAPNTILLLDLKGSDPLLPAMVRELMAECAPALRYAVCSRNWDYLPEFWDSPAVSVFHSVGSRRQLAQAWGRIRHDPRQGISIHRRLLSPLAVQALKEKAAAVVTWPVNDMLAFRQAVAAGVDGITTDSLDLLLALRAMDTGESSADPDL